MGLILELEESEFAGFIDDGEEFAATVTSIRLKDKPFKDPEGNVVKSIEFRFKLISDDGHDGRDIWGETSTRFNTNPECRLKNWSEAILGMFLPPHYKLDTDTLLDQRCVVKIGKKEYEDKEGRPKTRNWVKDVRPTAAAAKALAASAEDEPF